MPIGAILDISPASCTAPLGISVVDKPADRAASRMTLCTDGSLGAVAMSFITSQRISTPSSLSASANLMLDVLPHPFDLASVEIAQSTENRKRPGYYVRSTGFGPQVTDSTDQCTIFSPHDVADGQ